MTRFPNRTQTPPGGWRYCVPETGKTLAAPNEGALVEAIKRHHTANSMPEPPADIRDRIEAQVCAEQPGYCVDSTGHPPKGIIASAIATITRYIDGTRTLATWIASGVPMVDQATAESRASVCVDCPKNEAPRGCTACNLKPLKQLIETIVGARKTSKDEGLRGCSVCFCSNKAKVWVPIDTIRSKISESVYRELPENCWIKKEADK